VDVRFQEVVDSRIYQAVTSHRRDIPEGLGNDAYPEMAVASGGTSMAGMQVTFVFDDQNRGRKTTLEALAQPLLAAGIYLIHMLA
jgi:hypothetical protein